MIIAIIFPDDSVGRMQLIDVVETQRGLITFDWTDENIQKEIDKSIFSTGLPLSWRRVSIDDFPNDHHEFRAAWKDSGKEITVDMEKAKEITRDRLRAERAPLLVAKDVEVIRAIETNDQNRIEILAAEKQQLRDVTILPEIEAAKTPDELKVITIDIRTS